MGESYVLCNNCSHQQITHVKAIPLCFKHTIQKVTKYIWSIIAYVHITFMLSACLNQIYILRKDVSSFIKYFYSMESTSCEKKHLSDKVITQNFCNSKTHQSLHTRELHIHMCPSLVSTHGSDLP